jgi:hypothetical protein
LAELLDVDVDDPLVPEPVDVLLDVVGDEELEPALSVLLFVVVLDVEGELFEPFEDRESLR